MIIGGGMIANALQSIDEDTLLFFCSGVSNSGEENDEAFKREETILMSFTGTHRKLIYFSSYFVNFQNYSLNKYYQHKIHMEQLIRKSFNEYTIYRLPQVVGRSNNPNTLTNFIANKIIEQETLTLYSGARRNLIDIDDVVKVLNYANHNSLFINQSINLITPINYTIDEIVDTFTSVMDVKVLKEVIPSNEQELESLLEEEIKIVYTKLGITFDMFYLQNLIKKYYTRS